MTTAATIGELRASGYQVPHQRGDAQEPHGEIRRRRALRELLGYEDSVIPQIENALLSGQDIIFLGERGQAKSRIIRALVTLLDEEFPALAGCEIPENPFDPITRAGRDILAEQGDDAPIAWLPPRRALRREAGHARHHHRRPDRRESTRSRWRKGATSPTS